MPVQRTVSPIDGRLVAERELADAAAVASALERAGAAFPRWRATPVAERCALLSRAVDALVARRDAIAPEITWQMGRPIAQSPGEIRGLEERARYMLELRAEALADVEPAPQAGLHPLHPPRAAGRWCSSSRPGTTPTSPPSTASSRRWRPATRCCSSTRRRRRSCAERFQEAFDEAGLPAGVFQHLHLSHDAAAADRRQRRGPTSSLHRLGRRRARRPGRRPASAFIGDQPRARRQGPGLRPRRRRSRPRGREPGRRRVLQLRPELLRHRADLRPRAPSTTLSSRATSTLASRYVLGDPTRPRHHARADGPGSRPPTSRAARSARPCAQGARAADRHRAASSATAAARPTWPRNAWSTSTTRCA